ncbi:acyltransferase family protein [Phytoactinopolyspora limicola]|uniref:acyltransferase family protein n=1 Tax=Phytoactinopolyspora limicola TaxID=2715536 RepID=UPI001409AF37|nr:acyltransferase [Phytoactinopolyspora limicola]
MLKPPDTRTTGRPATVASRRPAHDVAPRSSSRRDPFIDVLRVAAIVLIVAQHWLMPAVSYDDGVLTTGNALTTPGAWMVTWFSQVMPLVFFAGGAAAAYSLGRPTTTDTSRWLHQRLTRLAAPVVPLVLVWLVLPHLLLASGLPAGPVDSASRLAGRLLWFLALYVLITALAPMLLRLHQRMRGIEVIGLAVAAGVVDLLRFGVFDGAAVVGYLNVLLVWCAAYQLGMAYATGRLHWLRGYRALAVAAAGMAATAVAVVAGPYPGSMIGMPGEPVSNMNPPTVVLLTITALQLGLAAALRPLIVRWTANPPVENGLRWLSARLMTIYVWHMPALIVVAGTAVMGLDWATPPLLSAEWREAMPIWLGSLLAVLAVMIAAFSRVERTARTGPARRPALIGLAVVLLGLGLLALAANGFTPELTTHPAGPFAASLAILAGAAIVMWPTRTPPTQGPRPVRTGTVPATVGLSPPPTNRAAGSPHVTQREKVGV